MPADCYIISDFFTLRPQHELTQQETLDWLVAVHTQAESTARQLNPNETANFAEAFEKTLLRVACKPGLIAHRGCEVADITHRDWDSMQIYRVNETPAGQSLEKRQHLHAQIVNQLFDRFYSVSSEPPEQIIHVSCTGYASPSGAQLLASKRGWTQTAVTHAYHMGCYAAIPALRMVNGSCEVVHTEICTLHNQPLLHSPEQIVVQSLFGDGFIKYSVNPETSSLHSTKPHFRILALHEELIPETSQAMSWRLGDSGFCMTLVPEIPLYLKNALVGYLETLCRKAKVELSNMMKNSYFAIHPGGPRILQSAQKLLNLNDQQIADSYSVLRDYGNMSSATLPHIWSRLLDDPNVPEGSRVVSVAFGPGLTIAGTILEKVIPCG